MELEAAKMIGAGLKLLFAGAGVGIGIILVIIYQSNEKSICSSETVS